MFTLRERSKSWGGSIGSFHAWGNACRHFAEGGWQRARLAHTYFNTFVTVLCLSLPNLASEKRDFQVFVIPFGASQIHLLDLLLRNVDGSGRQIREMPSVLWRPKLSCSMELPTVTESFTENPWGWHGLEHLWTFCLYLYNIYLYIICDVCTLRYG